MSKTPHLKQLFSDCRVIGLAGSKNQGKTNNLVFLIKNLRQNNPHVPIYAYGLPYSVMTYLSKEHKVKEVSSLRQIQKKENCILIIDEFQRLKLSDRRYRDDLDDLIDLIYHRNAYIIFSSPNEREFNSIIGSKIEKWLLKSIDMRDCINGSQLKEAIEQYKGRYKVTSKQIIVPKNELLVINNDEEMTIKCKYIEEADSKKELASIW